MEPPPLEPGVGHHVALARWGGPTQYKDILDTRAAVKDGNATAQQRNLAHEPLGSGAIESTCRHYQCRFKRTGQFWTTAGDEALLCLETLYPQAKSAAALN